MGSEEPGTKMPTQATQQPDSPCIGYCSTSLGDTICRGCGRTAEEVDQWFRLDEEQQRSIWDRVSAMDTIRNRRRSVAMKQGKLSARVAMPGRLETMDTLKNHDNLLEELRDLRLQLATMQAAAAEHEHAMKVMAAGKEQYSVLLDESSDPIFSFSSEGRYLYVNRAFASGLGKNQEDIIGKTIWDMFPLDEAEKRFAAVKWVFEKGESKVLDVRVPRPDGDRYYITTVKPILNDQGVVFSVICISKEITERKQMEDRLAHMAQHDALTDLPNRALFSERLLWAIGQARRHGTRLALMCLDLDNFKPVNDTFGHQVGDLLLQAAAKRMLECLRESDTIGRIGGDEFVILLPVVEQEQEALLVAEKIRASLDCPFDLPEHPGVKIASSTGIAIYPDHGDDEIQLIKNADQALYRAKREGRNRAWLFHPGGSL